MKSIRSILLLIPTCFICSCALQYTDEQGNSRVVGFASITLSKDSACNNPRLVSVETYGIGAVNLPSHGGITFGYAKNSVLTLDDNQSVTLKTPKTKTGKDNENE